jgi:hypothetical protein
MKKKTKKPVAVSSAMPESANGRVRVSAEALPRRSLEQVLVIADTLYKTYAGKSATWDDLARALSMKPANPDFRYLIWSAQAYCIVNKGEDKGVTLSETGRKIVAPTYPNEDQEAKVKAIMTPTVLSKFYSDYNGHPVPSPAHFANVLEGKYGVPRKRTEEAIELIMANGRFAGILEEQGAGAQPVVSLSGSFSVKMAPEDSIAEGSPASSAAGGAAVATDWGNVCFYITAIGDEGTEVRRHTDMLLKHLLEPVAKEFNLRVVRADSVEHSGIITQQIFEHLAKARLCVADLSFSNPNAFYELGVRHVCKLPTIQVIRKGDKIPFDVSQGRTITVDTSDIYTVIDRIESAKRELSEHIKYFQLNKETSGEDNPVSVYLPDLKVTLPQ